MFSQNNKLKPHLHFIGIGGSGMSGMAQLLINLGYKVSGSDIKESNAINMLRELGATIYIGHKRENIATDVDLVCFSSAIKEDNVEVIATKEKKLPLLPRARLLADIMSLKFNICIAGAHGKTTTTTLISHILEQANLDPTIFIGGKAKRYKSGAKLGKGNIFVAETDESDKSFLFFNPSIAIITNIDKEHLDAYNSLEEIQNSFLKFLEKIPFYGCAILNKDNQAVREVAHRYLGVKIYYSLQDPKADYFASNIEFYPNKTIFSVYEKGKLLGSFSISSIGEHIVQNCLAAIALARWLNINVGNIYDGLQSFEGIERRMELLGKVNNCQVFTDYAHHPTEIQATLNALKKGNASKKIIAVFQPHRFSRTYALFNQFCHSFNDCYKLFILPIYPANEENIYNVNSSKLANTMRQNIKNIEYIDDFSILAKKLQNEINDKHLLIFLGAGSIDKLARSFVDNFALKESRLCSAKL